MTALASSPVGDDPLSAEVGAAIAAIAAGEVVVVVDTASPANQGALVAAAQLASASTVNFMATHGRGLICVPMTQDRLGQLKIPPMTTRSPDRGHTAFHVGVDVLGTAAGMAAADRAAAARALASPSSTAADFTMPGHLFPVACHPDGLAARRGHPEAAVDLVRAAGCEPAAVVCGIANEDGSLAGLADLLAFAAHHQLALVHVDEVAALAAGVVAARVAAARLPLLPGDFTAIGFAGPGGREDMALVLGDVAGGDPLVLVHAECVAGDVFRAHNCGCRAQLDLALQLVTAEGCGVIVYLRGAPGPQQPGLPDDGREPPPGLLPVGVSHHPTPEEYAVAAAILRDLQATSVRLISADPQARWTFARHRITVSGCIAPSAPAA
jgi:3,4-dihydroxy 2-butanone 4-phosphate synthase/GTP cyclohydrolase II